MTKKLAESLKHLEGEGEEVSMHTSGSLPPLQLSTTQHIIGIHTNQDMRVFNVKALQTLISNVKLLTLGTV